MMTKMGKPRKKYTSEFKKAAVAQVVGNDRSVTEVAEGLGISVSLLWRWKAEMKDNGVTAFPGNGVARDANDELVRLRKELSVTQQERDILKKALGYFAKPKS